MYFEYGEIEINWLKSRDKALGEAIEKIGRIEREVTPDVFTALINSVAGQQISSKALSTVWGRMLRRFCPMTPEIIAAAPADEIQSCGMSHRKAEYISEIAKSVLSGQLDIEGLSELPDQEVFERLCAIKGIGVWTAEMLMIFCMKRPDVLSFSDLAIRRGLCMLHRHRELTPKLFLKYKRRYSPHATVASLYLWAIAGGALDQKQC